MLSCNNGFRPASFLAEALAVSLRGKVQVTPIFPGWIDTDYTVYDGPDAAQQPAGRVRTALEIVRRTRR